MKIIELIVKVMLVFILSVGTAFLIPIICPEWIDKILNY